MTQYQIIIAPRAKKGIDRLPAALKEKVANALIELSYAPYLGKPLKAELKGLYSFRVADYRIIYDILKTRLVIEVIKVMHRREVYR